jgi:hypothetical protein
MLTENTPASARVKIAKPAMNLLFITHLVPNRPTSR